MSATDEPRRQTPTERLHEVTMQALTRAPAAPESSVTLSRNAKGVAQFEIVVRHADPVKAYLVAHELYDQACRDFPYPDPADPGAPTTNGA